MAIKKGAFESYTKQGRELPSKSDAHKKKGFIFDNTSEQSSSQTVHKQEDESVHKRFTQSPAGVSDIEGSSGANGSQTVHKQEDGTVHKRFTQDPVQVNETGETKKSKGLQIIRSFRTLSDNPKKIVKALYKNSKRNGDYTTDELTLDLISALSGVGKKSLKNTLFRLNVEGVIKRVEQKDGRGGWVKYKIADSIIKEIERN